ncbi:Predicted dehydrogenase [Sinomicrobium oceani]|uniref:Predicted dehydrogenase n=1 Tax=Sinomicrobium oceani TaxID=1150368 RepID=A0A1K1PJB6_9FLAO|nr:Gfo/Idh/MocA family oxidoreductase [Sinomicrobium oceani]SFW47523.1 Predicted dehydrogenase [Sinomicrobium oceani]
MKNKIRTGLLSFGMSGKIFHAPFVKAHPEFELVAVVERTQKRAHEYYPGIKSYASVAELLNDDEIDLVIVNTPNNTHYEFALQALRNKKHVLVEKPFTSTSEEAAHLFREAAKNHCHVLPYHNRRYDSDFLSVKKVLESEKTGQPVEVYFRFERYKYTIGEKRFKEEAIPGSGLQYDLGSHLLDGVISLFGIPRRWHKTLGAYRPGSEVDDYVHIHLEYENGLQVFVKTSLLVLSPQPAFVINGTRGTYVKDRTDVQEKQLLEGMQPGDPGFGVEEEHREGILTWLDDRDVKHTEKVAAAPASYLGIFEAVYQTLRHHKPYPVTEAQILAQLNILEG